MHKFAVDLCPKIVPGMKSFVDHSVELMTAEVWVIR